MAGMRGTSDMVEYGYDKDYILPLYNHKKTL